MKKLAVIALEKHTITNLKNDLNYIFRNVIDIEWYYMEDSNFSNSINADLILYTSPNYYYMTRGLIASTAEVIMMKRTISREGYEKLLSLKNIKKAMMVNRTLEMAVETISQLRELGINHIDLVPVYPGTKNIPNLEVAITPDHVNTVPQNAKHIVNIGNRKLDISTIMDITAKLDINVNQIEQRISNYAKQIVPISNGLNKIINIKNELDKALELMVNINDKAIIIMNKDKSILKKNELADKILELDDSETVKNEMYEILGFMEVLNTGHAKKDFIITYNDKNIIVSNYPIIYIDTLQGSIAICEEFNDFEKRHQNMKRKPIN
jgi:transcriptional regulator with PAS, ATPase and Fis domain